jgi:aspartate/glutamate racemase
VIVIATNTMHRVYPEVQAAVKVPVISVLDVVADAIHAAGLQTVGLLGTRYTMEGSLYPDALTPQGIGVLIPDEAAACVCKQCHLYRTGQRADFARNAHPFLEIIANLAERGAQGIILGCTEIPLLVHTEDTPLPLFDTTVLHLFPSRPQPTVRLLHRAYLRTPVILAAWHQSEPTVPGARLASPAAFFRRSPAGCAKAQSPQLFGP